MDQKQPVQINGDQELIEFPTHEYIYNDFQKNMKGVKTVVSDIDSCIVNCILQNYTSSITYQNHKNRLTDKVKSQDLVTTLMREHKYNELGPITADEIGECFSNDQYIQMLVQHFKDNPDTQLWFLSPALTGFTDDQKKEFAKFVHSKFGVKEFRIYTQHFFIDNQGNEIPYYEKFTISGDNVTMVSNGANKSTYFVPKQYIIGIMKDCDFQNAVFLDNDISNLELLTQEKLSKLQSVKVKSLEEINKNIKLTKRLLIGIMGVNADHYNVQEFRFRKNGTIPHPHQGSVTPNSCFIDFNASSKDYRYFYQLYSNGSGKGLTRFKDNEAVFKFSRKSWDAVKNNNQDFAEYREERHKKEQLQAIEVVEEKIDYIDNIELVKFSDESYDKNADEISRFQSFKDNISKEYGKEIPNCNLSLVNNQGNEELMQMEFKMKIDDKAAYAKLSRDVYREFVYKNSSGNISVYNVTELEANQYGKIKENSYLCRVTISKNDELTQKLKKPPVQQQYQK
ncbi:hypothetical protein [Candidatus Deianiraea vastatrix]|uniref:Uncharacterized protein n=1 Tax=Candidatus Deianiraea vastatrix TaxID=2163644 RepID=A0A5B8XEP1_9RICK|nr:hypothetical protein [Candidatus Deianiraea vastatrix]QED22874.1 hypothetical protein Deia_00060 [Candidatus Deianiraea vastatrix]